MNLKEPLSLFAGLLIGLLGYELFIYFVNPYEAAWLSIITRVVVISTLTTFVLWLFKGETSPA